MLIRRFAAVSAGIAFSFCSVAIPGVSAQAEVPVQPGSVQLSQARTSSGSVTVPEASDFVSRLAERAIEGLTDKNVSLVERTQRFRHLLTEGFDVPQIGRFVLGRYWRVATEDERAEYLRLFEDFIVSNYATRFGEYAGENLKIGAATRTGEADITVSSELIRPNGAPVRVEWKVRQQDGGFKITDVAVEGVSMTITQRDDFSASIQRNGGKVEGLLTMLREKVRTAQN
jgi:phospholipid transport system substrate-binding protein